MLCLNSMFLTHACNVQSKESVQSYVTRLRKLATSCKYGKLTDDFIRDRLVSLKDNVDKVRLLREKKLGINYRAIQMCRCSEVTSQ